MADIRMIWGIAKSAELQMTDEELHLLVQAQTGKDSIKALNKRELAAVTRRLLDMKDSAKKEAVKRMVAGTPATEKQRKLVFHLAHELGWQRAARINGFCQKLFSVGSVDWLNYQQCSKLIEVLKKMVERNQDEERREEDAADNNKDM